MATVTIRIEDVNDSVEVEGHIDSEALNNPPTVALVIGTYISTNVNTIAKDAMTWFKKQVEEDNDDPKLFVPKQAEAGND